MMALSVLIPLEGLSNTRDLGGMTAADGRRIRTGKLLRSGHLCEASLSSLRYISRTVGTVIDLRSESERTERPDPVIEGVENIHLPVVENLVPGSAGGEMSNETAFMILSRDPEKARAHMINTYEGFVKDNAQVEEYSRFMRLLLREREKAVLWHCTAGKDRAGFASALVEYALGVSRDDITDDYMATNDHLRHEVVSIKAAIRRAMGDAADERTELSLDHLLCASDEYLSAAFGSIERGFGDLDGFMEHALGIGPKEREKLMDMYLE